MKLGQNFKLLFKFLSNSTVSKGVQAKYRYQPVHRFKFKRTLAYISETHKEAEKVAKQWDINVKFVAKRQPKYKKHFDELSVDSHLEKSSFL